QRQRRLEQNIQIEQHRPVLDIVEIELDALLDFLFAIDLAAPAVHLRPAGDAGLDAMAREIAINGLVEQPALQSALHGVRARADQRQVALEYDIEELRQFVEAGPADEAADAGDAAVVPGHDPGSRRIGLIVIERAKLEDVDALVVEPEPLLTEQHRSGTVELDRQRDQRHQRRGQQQGGGTDDVVEQPFHHQVPVGDRRFEHVEGRNLAKVGIGAGAKAQLVGVRGQPDIDRQHPELLQHLENPDFRRNRQGKQHEIDAGAAGELDDVVDLAQFRGAGAGVEGPAVVAIVEHAEDIDVGIGLGSQRFDQLFAASIGADDDGAATEPPLARPTADHRAQQQPLGNQRREAADEKCRKPQPRYLAAELRKERNADEQQEHECPRGDQPCELPELATKHLHLVDVGSLETDHRGSGHGKDGGDIGPVKTVMANHVADI